MEIIVAIANQVNGAFGVLILSLAGIGILLYKTGGWASEFKRYKQKTDKHDDNFKKVDANITALRSDLIEMTSSILNIVSSWQITQGHSPLTLTDKGEKIRKNLNADLIIKKYKYELLTYISDIGKINNPYDIQTLAFKAVNEHLLTLLDNNENDLLKKEAFNQGIYMETLKTVFKILLRDEILKEKGIAVSDIDKHTPKDK